MQIKKFTRHLLISCHSNRFFCVFALGLVHSFCCCLLFYNPLSVLVQFQFDNYNLAWMNAYMDRCTIGLFTLDSFSENYHLFTVHLHNFSNLLTFVMSPGYLDFIIFPNWHTANIVFLSEFFRE